MFAKYGVSDGWNLSVPHSAYGCSPWHAIMKNLNKFMSDVGYKVENGRKIRFWLVAWCGRRPLAMKFLDLFAIIEDPYTIVSRCFSVEGNGVVWHPIFRRDVFDWETPRVVQFLSRLQDTWVYIGEEDQRVWMGDPEGNFQ